jgi:hypothetical protein
MPRKLVFLLSIAAILIVATAVGDYVLTSGNRGSGGTQCGWGRMAISTPLETQRGASYFYNFTIESAATCVAWNEVDLQITNNGGTNVSSGITSYTVYNATLATVCSSKGPTETAWTPGAAGSGSTFITSAQTLVALTTVNLANTGAQLAMVGVGSVAGTTHATIP